MAPREIARAREDTELELRVYAAGVLRGDVGEASAASQISGVSVELRATGQISGRNLTEAALTCPVETRGGFHCSAPTGKWRVVVRLAGQAPWVSREIAVARGETTDLGSIPRRDGGTLIGTVLESDGSIVPSPITVILRPASAGEQDALNARGRKYSTVSDASGEVRLRGVPAGTWNIEFIAESDWRGAVDTVEIRKGELTELGAVTRLQPARRFAVHVDPALHPEGEPWRVEVLRHESAGSTVMSKAASGNCDDQGDWRSPAVYGDQFAVRVVGPRGGQFGWREVTARDPSEIWFDLPLVWVQGTVALGDEPVRSTVRFEGSKEGGALSAESGDDGEFGLVLPRPGAWQVRVDSKAVRVSGYREAVEVVPHGRSASLNIRLPDTVLRGDVADQRGSPVSGALVELRSTAKPAPPIRARTDAKGGFEFRALDEGLVSVSATDERRSAGPITVLVSEQSTPTVHLELRRTITIWGVVQSGTGTVADASVLSFPVLGGPPPTIRGEDRVHSGAGGQFSLRIPAGTDRLVLVTLVPGYALNALEIQDPDGSSLISVRLRTDVGTLTIPAWPLEGDTADRLPFVIVNGVVVDFHLLRYWAAVQDDAQPDSRTIQMGGMPPGDYALCQFKVEVARLVMAGQALPDYGSCDVGSLNAGGRLALEAPRQAASDGISGP